MSSELTGCANMLELAARDERGRAGVEGPGTGEGGAALLRQAGEASPAPGRFTSRNFCCVIHSEACDGDDPVAAPALSL